MPRKLPNWLEAYLAYTGESESPEEYHLWVGISTIAGALRRKVFFDMGYFLLYPNMYIVLVGPPGRCKKSTAMRIGRNIAGAIPGIEFSVDSTTRERMIQDMSQAFKDGQSALTVHSTEFASLLTSSGMDMVVFLTDIFDSPNEWTHKTKASGTNKIKAPYLNMVGATTPDWIAKAMPLDTIGIGLTSRIVFVFQDTPREADPIPKLSPAQLKLAELLIEDLGQIALISGEYKFDSEESLELYKSWYRARFQDPNPSGDPRLAGYYERKPTHLLKLCIIVAAACRDDPLITAEDFVTALKLFDKIEQRMPKVFQGVGKNPIYADMEDTLEAIMANSNGFTTAELLQRFSHSLRKEELLEVIETLIAMNKIVYKPNGRYYKI